MSSLNSFDWLTDARAAALALVAGTLFVLILAYGLAFRGFHRRTAADQRVLERLRDEVWELRAATEARDRAEAANEAKSRFLATVSHEVRTPLNGILGMADLLTATSIDDEQKSYVEAIRASGQSLATLVDDLLDLSRIEAGRLDLISERFAIGPLVEGVVELLAPRAHIKGLEIASFIAPDVPAQTVGDAARLRQILLNVAGNAVKFTQSGGVGLRVTCEAQSLAIAVTDTGPGVPFDRREAIFADFEQGDEALARQHGGTGLGLAISKHLVERMGGQLSLAHSSDRGSTFAISLPLPPDVVASEPQAGMSGQNVLIVSPSRFEAAYLRERSSSCGADATHVATELDALAHLQSADATPHTVLIDCAFGEFATIALAEAARKAGANRLFVLFSPTERRELRAETLRGFDGWLVKPVRSASLFARLAPQAEPAGSGARKGHDIAPKLRGVHVLLAEDNEISRRVALKHLERHGARVTCAVDGAEAARIADAEHFDVMILDVRMPVLDGLGAARRIRSAEPSERRTPLIALTANAFPADKRAAIDAGIDYFLAKPVDPFDLVALIEKALASAQKPEALSRAS